MQSFNFLLNNNERNFLAGKRKKKLNASQIIIKLKPLGTTLDKFVMLSLSLWFHVSNFGLQFYATNILVFHLLNEYLKETNLIQQKKNNRICNRISVSAFGFSFSYSFSGFICVFFSLLPFI